MGGNPGGGYRVAWGGGLALAQKREICWSQADVDSTGPGEGEQKGAVLNYLRTPKPREGKQLAKATQKPVAELAV